MTPTPLPTPYDITAFPVFPFIPAWYHWLIAALASGAFAGFFWYGEKRSRRRRPALKAFAIAENELSLLLGEHTGSTVSREILARASLIVRRLLAAVEGMEFPAMAPNELAAAAQGAKSQEIKLVLANLAAVEGAKFQPSCNVDREVLCRLFEAFKRYRLAWEERAK